MAVNKRLLQGAAAAPGGLVPSEHFGVVLYEGDGSSSHSINGGKFGAAFYGNGSNSLISVLPLSFNLQPYSVSCWFNTRDIANYRVIWGTQTLTSNGTLDVTNSGKLRFYMYSTPHPNLREIISTTTLSANTWYHAVALWDGSNIKLYLNGSLEGSDTATSMRSYNSGFFNIGAKNASQYFSGKIDQFRVFQKALSSSEVSTLYAETASTVESLDPLSEDTTDTLQVLGDSSCIATYRFENNEDDESGNYDGTGTAIQYAAGRYGQAASFDGSSSNISLSTGFSVDTSFTVSFWMKSNQSASSYIFQFLGDTGETYMNSLGLFEAGTKFGLWPYNATSGQGLSSISTSDTSSLFDNNWHHVAVVTDGTSNTSTKIYVDGDEKTITTGESYTTTWRMTGNVTLGHRSDGANHYDGLLDQLRIFNKALSASEVTTLYNENSLVASYRFEGNANDDTRNYDGTASNVTYEYGLNFTPDFVWAKCRDVGTTNHTVVDSTRGASETLRTHTTNAETTRTNGITSFDSGGFSVGDWVDTNGSGRDFVAWCLKANGGTTSSNTDGSTTSTVQANQDAGFSIVKYTGNGTAGATIGHGLGVIPEVIIVKKTSATSDWIVYHASNTGTSGDASQERLKLQTTDATADIDALYWNATSPTSSVITLGSSNNTNHSGQTFVMYAFASTESFSKFGSYTGNGSSQIIETGFEPAFLMLKSTSQTGDWAIFDNKRNPPNDITKRLKANTSDAESTSTTMGINFLSNGFNFEGAAFNDSGRTFIYMAFAADPDTEAPTVAKSFSTNVFTDNASATSLSVDIGFKPGLVWTKYRGGAQRHYLWDNLRGTYEYLSTDTTDSSQLRTFGLQFDDYGFTKIDNVWNRSDTDGIVAWAWKADDNEPTINTEGSIDSLVSANANAGFSIVKYEGNGTSGATIGHGLSASPELIITKNLEESRDWRVFHTDLSTNQFLSLNTSGAAGTAPTNTCCGAVASVDATSFGFVAGSTSSTEFDNVNKSGINYIAYCFHSVSGYSKISEYQGNGNATGPTITTGFQPDFVMIKNKSATNDWLIYDSVRGGDVKVSPNTSNAEVTVDGVNFLSNGFSINGTDGALNGSTSQYYIYMAFKIN